MNPQTLARLTGVLFLITYVTSIPALFVFYAPVLKDPGYITGAGPDTSVLVGAFLEVLLIIANVGTALTLFPALKRHNEVLALGYVTARLVECGFIAVGILSLVTVVTLRQQAAGADAASLTLVGQALVAMKNWTFLLGPAFVGVLGTGLMLGDLMYRSGLVPRPMAVLGLIGGVLLCASRGALCCWAPWSKVARRRLSRPCPSSSGSCRSVSISPSKASSPPRPLPSQPGQRRTSWYPRSE